MKIKHIQLKIMGKSKFKFYRLEMLPIMNYYQQKIFISDKKLSPEIVSGLKRTEEEEQKVDREKIFLNVKKSRSN